MSDEPRKAVAFNLRLPPADHDRLLELAEHLAITPTSVLRMLVKLKHDEVCKVGMLADARKGNEP